jgi:integrase
MANIISHAENGPTIMRIARKLEAKTYLSKKWYYRVWAGRRAVYFPLDENASRARALAARIRDYLRSGVTSVQEAREQFCSDLLARRARAKVATIGEVLDCLEAKRTVLGLEPSSSYAYQNSLTIVVETVLQHRRNGDAFNREAVRSEPLSTLTRKLLNDFKQIRQEVARDGGVLNYKSAQRTINKHLRNAKAIFKESALDVYRDEGLSIPDLGDFLSTPLISRLGVEYQLPRSDLIRRVAHAMAHGLDGNEQLAAMLALHAGLRADEIAHARWSWLRIEERTTPYLRVQAEADFDTKNHRCRSVPLQSWFADWLNTRKPARQDYVLSGPAGERGDDAFRRLAVWLHGQGVEPRKPMHELRKWFGSFAVFSTGSFAKAQKMLGHRSAQTTNDYYADLEFSPTLAAVWTDREISIAA